MKIECCHCGKDFEKDRFTGWCDECFLEIGMRDRLIDSICRNFVRWLDELHSPRVTPEQVELGEFLDMANKKFFGKIKARTKFLLEEGGIYQFQRLLEKQDDEVLIGCMANQICQSCR